MFRSRALTVAFVVAGCSFVADVAAGGHEARQQAGVGGVGGGNPPALNAAAREVLAAYPGTRIHAEQGRVRIIYGAPMTAGATPRDAAEMWLVTHGGAFGAGRVELHELWATPVMNGRFTAFGYGQQIDGMSVEYGNVRVLVLNGGRHGDPRVVYAGATIAPPLAAAGARVEMDGETAQKIVRAMPLFRNLPRWSEPELAIFQGDGKWIDPVLTWKFIGEDLSAERSKTFFVDAATGRLVHIRNEIHHSDINGSVRGWATPGLLPDTETNPPTLQDIPEVRVRVLGAGGPSAFTTREGLFTIGGAGTSVVEVGTGLGIPQGFGGRWVNVVPAEAAPIMQTLPVTPPTPPGAADFILNPSPGELLTAQVNVFIGTTLVHNYFRDRAPAFTGLDIPLRANTGVPGTCNAFFRASDPSINFYNAGFNQVVNQTCPNTAYSAIIAHEYGHFIVNRLGQGQGGFGEGYSDTTAMLLYDDGVVGRGFFGPGTILRDPANANVQYPCIAGIHHCGQILGGSWWRIREGLGVAHGTEQGLAMARDMQVAWSLITNGGTGSDFRNSAHPGTAIEVLTIDDDDGNLANGTPNRDQICSAFAAHGIECPPLTHLEFELPQGVPVRTPIGEALAVPVNLIPVASAAQQGSLTISYRIGSGGGGGFTAEPAMQVGEDQYIAMLPAAPCGAFIDFYFTAQAIGGETVRHPAEAPESFFTARAVIGAAETVAADHDFESDAGWTVWNDPGGAAPPRPPLTEGYWERVIPRGTFSNNEPVQPGSAFRGERCYVTQNGAPGSPINSHDVDWGPTVLTSPAIDITGADFADLSFAYWQYTLNGLPDSLEVDVSSDDGANWVRIAAYGNTSGWRRARFDLLDVIEATANLRVRFSVADVPNDSVTESAVDDVRVVFWRCPGPECYANCDDSTIEPILNVDDFTCFINAFAAAQGLPHEEQVGHYANCDDSTVAPVLNVDDFTCFINEFAAGCP